VIRTALALLLPSLLIGSTAASSANVMVESNCGVTVAGTHIKPDFAAYHVPVDKRRPVPIRIRTRHERFYATRLRNAPYDGGIFAGHYAIALWGCGAGCREMAIVDYRSGAIHWLPQLHRYSTMNIGEEYGDFDVGVRFKADSRLLVFVGTPENESDGWLDRRRDGVSFFEWRNDRLHLLRFVSGRKLCPHGSLFYNDQPRDPPRCIIRAIQQPIRG
jgi:hypothetical protein